MLPSFATQEITLVHPVWTADARNVRRPDYGAAAERVPVPGCSVQPGASAEVLGGRDSVAVRWSVYAPAGTVVEATDAVEYLGKLYRVEGQPQAWPSATGALDHVLLLLLDWG
ncbi:head-to-tail stopper [Arthrobacter phage Andrew]|uniref:Head-to-tail stopper n=1 Tax=Arthrobacter phage Andrew TaxID=2419946 RepID=A0A3G2KCV8_9CAUD|nr:head closure Hc1 [Arthrobacter phage Andrew]AYN56827.1 head-to-tail stopper [Arthrobacter phage Andrew]